ncbi:hypothetical protein scyTo_0002478, partial [Scyliorhinus torazame]|nr:hypothetical protein [Scyliorhinus torazame]
SFDDGIVQLKDISVWREEAKKIYPKEKLEDKEQDEYFPLKEKTGEEGEEVPAQIKPKLNDNVSLYRGDITKLKIDAVVNAVVFGKGWFGVYRLGFGAFGFEGLLC